MPSELRNKILQADDLESEVVDVPQWGVEVEIRSLSGRDRAALNRVATSGDGFDLERWYSEILIATVHDPETGERVFEKADAKALGGKSNAALERLAQTAMRISGMAATAVDEAEEEFEGNPN